MRTCLNRSIANPGEAFDTVATEPIPFRNPMSARRFYRTADSLCGFGKIP